MKALVTNWNLFRFLRLLLGIGVIIKGATDGEVVFAVAGVMVALMALANIGCCGSQGCAVPRSSLNTSSTEQKNITYEEVGSTK
jgi:hypothetical protein